MKLKAVLFGAIGTLSETSDMQRRAFNLAFADAGVDWQWDADVYRDLLNINGGQARIRAYETRIGAADGLSAAIIADIHAGKTAHYANLLAVEGLSPRPGVSALIDACHTAGVRIALCTSTSIDNVRAITDALRDHIDFGRFAIITSLADGIGVKPLPDAYHYALVQSGLRAADCIAIEDSPVSIAAAKAAGLFTLATPGQFVRDQDFGAADSVYVDLSGVTLAQLDAALSAVA